MLGGVLGEVEGAQIEEIQIGEILGEEEVGLETALEELEVGDNNYLRV